MSLINQMLRDLDKRHAPDGLAGPATRGMSEHAQAVPARAGMSDLFWRIMAAAMLFAVAWVAWVVWQLMPRPIVTDLAYQSARAPAVAKSDPAPPAAAAVKAEAAPAPKAETPAPQAAARPAFDMLRLATELTTPVPQRRANAPRGKVAPKVKEAAAQPIRAAQPAEGKIDRRANTSANYRAEQEFRRAVALVNQGRIAEGMDGLRRTLEIDPRHEAARQTLVALLLEAKRVDDAAGVLREGLAFNSENTGFAMLLARIMVERKDVSAALSLLRKHAAPPDRNPDFHAFTAALYQRLDRHNEAIEQYQTALRLAPSGSVWWVGLAISYQAVDRPKDALEAFTRARSAGDLAPGLVAFVDQRLRQLQ